MRVMNRALVLLMLFLILSAMCLPIVATAEMVATVDREVPVKYQYIYGIRCELSIGGEAASINSYVRGTNGSTTKCEIELKLQKKFMFWWTTVETWNKTALSYQTSLNARHSVESGKTYRAVAVCTVWNGSSPETATAMSAAVEAP